MNTQLFLTHSFLVAAFLFAPFHPAVILQGDAPGILIDPTENVQTSEAGSTAELSVVLDFPPTANVTLSVQSSNPAEGTVDPAELIFTPELWDSPLSITVTGQPDDIDDGDQVYAVQFSVSSDDPGYAALSVPDVPVTNLDVDTAGVQVNPQTGLQTSESGGTDSFRVTLASRPLAAVTVQASSLMPDEVSVSPASVTIQPADWAQPAVFTLQGQPDDVVDGPAAFTISLALQTDDPLYAAQALPNVTGTNTDADSAGAIVTPTSGLQTSEAGLSDTFSVSLTSQPSADVTIHALSETPAEANVSPESIVVAAADWNLPVEFTVTGVADTAVDGDASFSISLSATSADPLYNGLTLPSVTGTNADASSALEAVNDSYQTDEDTELNIPAPGILANDASPGTLAVVLPLIAEPAEGALTVQANGAFVYNPPEDFNGTVTFQYQVTDGTATSNTATVTIDVQPVNDPPVAEPDSFISRMTSVTISESAVLANDSDVDSPELSAVLYTGVDPAKGSVVQNTNGSFTFTAAPEFEGDATFTYRAFDGETYSPPATMTVTIDRTAPVPPTWTVPVGTEGTYNTTGGMVTLQVTTPADAVRVRFYRWDHDPDVLAYVYYPDIENPPFALTIDAGSLTIGQNQVFADCYDAAGNRSARSRIIINLEPNLEPQAYLPIIMR